MSGSSQEATASGEGGGSGRGSGWLHYHLRAQVFQSANEPPFEGLMISLIEGAATEFLVFLFWEQGVGDHHEQGDVPVLPTRSCGHLVRPGGVTTRLSTCSRLRAATFAASTQAVRKKATAFAGLADSASCLHFPFTSFHRWNRPCMVARYSTVLTTVYNWLILVFGEPLKTTDLSAMLLQNDVAGGGKQCRPRYCFPYQKDWK